MYHHEPHFNVHFTSTTISSKPDGDQSDSCAPPRVDITQSRDEFRRYVRKEDSFSPDDAEYKAGNSVENRKKPPRDQVPGDVFDRQRVIVEFDQLLIERQACLVIGTGGIGQNTALVLARLGVGRIFLLDYDEVEASNLTRQCLSGMQDVGRKKVDAAKDAIEMHHNLRSHVTTLHGDVTLLWPSIVAIAKKCTVIFNCVDVGLMFDYCVNSLSKELRIPLVSGQSFAWKMMSEVYAGDPHTVCHFCQETTERSFALEKRSLCAEHGLLNRLRAFVKAKVCT
jgi:molybdopterin/thiamine biosynthesis adenylyltransferase